jgi:hypothetical protein
MGLQPFGDGPSENDFIGMGCTAKAHCQFEELMGQINPEGDGFLAGQAGCHGERDVNTHANLNRNMAIN